MTPNGCHVEAHEHVLAKVLVGDLERSAGPVRSLISDCPSCRSRLEELITLAELMELEGQDGEELLASLDYERKAPGNELVAPFFEQRVSELPERPERRWKAGAWQGFAAAAAAVLATGLGLWITGERAEVATAPRQAILLGRTQFQFGGATGQVDEYDSVTWNAGNLSGADRYEISLIAGDSDRLLDTFVVELATWTPTAEQIRTLPDRIRILVVPLGVSGQSLGAPGSVEVRRSR